MRIELDLELKDTPGQLVRALEPISRLGGNIISIVHIREEASKERRLPVKVIIDVEKEALERIISELESDDIWVAKVGEARKKERITVMLIGHVVDTDLRDTIDRLNEIDDVMVADMALSMPHPDHPDMRHQWVRLPARLAPRRIDDPPHDHRIDLSI